MGKNASFCCVLFTLFCFSYSSHGEDGFSTSPAKTQDGVVIGSSVMLTVDGESVYSRFYGQKSNPKCVKGKPFDEDFFIGGVDVLQLAHSHGVISAWIIPSNDKYEIYIKYSSDRSAVSLIRITSRSKNKEYAWKRDASGYLTDFNYRSTDAPKLAGYIQQGRTP